MIPALNKKIESAVRSLEEARRIAYRDHGRLRELIEQLNVLAELRLEEGDFRKAESLYREALFRTQEVRGASPDIIVGVHSLLAFLYDRWDRHAEAAELYQRALVLAAKAGALSADTVATVKNNLGVMFKRMRELDKAASWYQQALAEFRRLYGEQHPKVATVCNNLGVLFYQTHDIDRALEMHVAALRIREGFGAAEADPADLARALVNLAAAHKTLGEFQKAHEFTERARAIGTKLAEPKPTRRTAAALDLDRTV